MQKSEQTNYPPLPLIKTWVWMMVESKEPELKEKGRENIINAFGSLANANEYLTQVLTNK